MFVRLVKRLVGEKRWSGGLRKQCNIYILLRKSFGDDVFWGKYMPVAGMPDGAKRGSRILVVNRLGSALTLL